ncbi:hypothetical protein GEMRC1_000430 [Eukaryota sp. GEM-RC1]
MTDNVPISQVLKYYATCSSASFSHDVVDHILALLCEVLSTLLLHTQSPPPLIVSHCISGLSSITQPSKNVECLCLIPSLLSNPATPERSRLFHNTLLCCTSPSSTVRLSVCKCLPFLCKLVAKNPAKLKSHRAKLLNAELSKKILSACQALLSDTLAQVKKVAFGVAVVVLDQLPICSLSSTLASKITETLGFSGNLDFVREFDNVIVAGSVILISSKYPEFFQKLTNGLLQQIRVSQGSLARKNLLLAVKWLAVSLSLEKQTPVTELLENFSNFVEFFNEQPNSPLTIVPSFSVDCVGINSNVLQTLKVVFAESQEFGKVLVLKNLQELFLLMSLASTMGSPHFVPKIIVKFLNCISSGLADSNSSVIKQAIQFLTYFLKFFKKDPRLSSIRFNSNFLSAVQNDVLIIRNLLNLHRVLLSTHHSLNFAAWRQRLVYCKYLKLFIKYLSSQEILDYISALIEIVLNYRKIDSNGNVTVLPQLFLQRIVYTIFDSLPSFTGIQVFERIESFLEGLADGQSMAHHLLFLEGCRALCNQCPATYFIDRFLDKYLKILQNVAIQGQGFDVFELILTSIISVKALLASGVSFFNEIGDSRQVVDVNSCLFDIEEVFFQVKFHYSEFHPDSDTLRQIEDEYAIIDEHQNILVWGKEEEERRLARDLHNRQSIKNQYDAVRGSTMKNAANLSPAKLKLIDKKLRSFVV